MYVAQEAAIRAHEMATRAKEANLEPECEETDDYSEFERNNGKFLHGWRLGLKNGLAHPRDKSYLAFVLYSHSIRVNGSRISVQQFQHMGNAFH